VLDFNVQSLIHNYKVKFIKDTGYELKNLVKKGDVIIVDERINQLYPDIFQNLRFQNKVILLTANENQKSYEGIKYVIEELLKSGFKKNNKLIAIGGGIIQDVTAFISSVIFRGVKWFFFPTTLLAQGDSCIGSKTSINFGKYKNQLGGFYPPNKICINLKFLDTLSQADIQSGFGEMSHYFVIKGKEPFQNFKNAYLKKDFNEVPLAQIISKSLLIKKEMIEIDEFDRKERQIFNYGHSFGHAIESLTNYSIPHGIAVSFGMDIANYISVKQNYLKESVRDEIRDFLINFWNDYSIKNLEVNKFLHALSKDKKNIGNKLRIILCKGYGSVFISTQEVNHEFKKLINSYFKKQAY